VPGTLYGRAAQPLSLQVTARALGSYLDAHGSGALMDLEIAGEVTPVMLKELDRHPTSGAVTHVSFQRVVLTERVHASIPLRFIGVEDLIDRGLVLQTRLDAVELTGQADRLPETLTIDVTGLAAGDAVHLSAILLTEGIELTRDGDLTAAIVTAPRTPETAPTEAA
jgi:large subunit ribosomal protein L25